MNFVSTISLIFISINCLNGEENGSSKIVGGQVTEIENFPYLAQLVFKKVQICGASIISNLWLISAAHCYDKDNIILSDYTIRTGSSRRTRGGKIHEIEQMTPNPNYFYDSPRVDFDLLLIKVKRSILFSDRQRPIKLPINDNPISIGTEVVVVGWGDTKDNKESNEILRALVMNTISIDLCKNRISAVDISFNVICTDTPPPAIQTTCKVNSIYILN